MSEIRAVIMSGSRIKLILGGDVIEFRVDDIAPTMSRELIVVGERIDPQPLPRLRKESTDSIFGYR